MVCRKTIVDSSIMRAISFEDCLTAIVTHVQNDVPCSHLNILGFAKVGCNVTNTVNGRSFSEIDAEHFLCKAWLIAKLTFGHYRISKHPELSSHYTHPSPVVHSLTDVHVSECMRKIVESYKSCIGDNVSNSLVMPELCKLPGETV
jgi:hypothetical protein